MEAQSVELSNSDLIEASSMMSRLETTATESETLLLNEIKGALSGCDDDTCIYNW